MTRLNLKKIGGVFNSEEEFRKQAEAKGYHVIEIFYHDEVVKGFRRFTAWTIYIRNLSPEAKAIAKKVTMLPRYSIMGGDVIKIPKFVDAAEKVK